MIYAKLRYSRNQLNKKTSWKPYADLIPVVLYPLNTFLIMTCMV